MNKNIIVGIVILLLIVVGVGYFTKSNKVKDVSVVKIGYQDAISSAFFFIAQEKKFFEEEGLSVEPVKLSSSNEAYEALVRGDIDFAPGVGVLPVLINAPKVGDVVKVASLSAISADDTFDKLVTKDDKIKTLKDLEGKKIALFPGTTPTTFLKLFLKKNNVNIDKISFIQTPPQNQVSVLEAGSVDALFGYEPSPSIAQFNNPNVRILVSNVLSDVYPLSPLGSRLVTKDFMCDKKDVFDKVQKALDRAQDLVKENHNEYVTIISKRMNISPDIVKNVKAYQTFSEGKKEKLVSFEEFLISNGELKEKTNIDSLVSCI